MQVVRDVLGVEFAPVTGVDEDAMGNLEVLEHEDEIEIHCRPLDAAQRHRKAPDQGVTNLRGVELTAKRGDDLREIH
jgi:hypothetical protein